MKPKGTTTNESEYVFFEPQNPVRGMNSSLNPYSLPNGVFPLLENVRFDTQSLYVRNGFTQLASAVDGAAIFRGAYHGFLNATEYITASYEISGSTRVYSLDPSAFTWSELTHDGSIDARNGNTRLTPGLTSKYTTIKDNTAGSKEYLLIQNGTDFPRIYDPSQSVYERVSIHQPITVPNPAGFNVNLSFAGQTQINPFNSGASGEVQIVSFQTTSVGVVTVNTSGSHGLSTGNSVTITIGTGGPGTEQINGCWTVLSVPTASSFTIGVTITGNTGSSLSGTPRYLTAGIGTTGQFYGGVLSNADYGTPSICISPQVASGQAVIVGFGLASQPDHLVLASSGSLALVMSGPISVLQNIAIDICNGYTGPFTTIYDTSAQVVNYPGLVSSIDSTNSNSFVATFSLANVASTDPNLYCRYLRFRWVGSSPVASPAIFYIGSVAGLSGAQGGSQYALSWFNSRSRAESPGYILSSPLVASGVQLQGKVFTSAQIPNSPILSFQANLTATNVSSGEILKGTDTINVYRQDTGEVFFSLADSITVNTFASGSWITSTAGTQLSFSDSVPVTAKNVGRLKPDGFSLTIPKGTSVLTSGPRLYVGGVNSSDVYISEANVHTRFRSQVRFLDAANPDPVSATINSFSGQIVTGLVSIGGRYVGVDPVVIFTNSSVYRIDGLSIQALSKPTRIALHGAPFGGVYCTHLDYIYWIDEEKQVQRMSNGSPQPISKLVIDNMLPSANLNSASLAVLNDRIYFAFSDNVVNQKVLVYETVYGGWCLDILENLDAAQFLTIDDNVIRKLYGFSKYGAVFQYEQGTTDAGTPISVNITTPYVHDKMNRLITVGPLLVTTDSVSSTLAVDRSWDNIVYGQNGTLNLANANGNRSWIKESLAGAKPGGSGVAVQTSISGTLPSGTRIFQLSMPFQEGDERANT